MRNIAAVAGTMTAAVLVGSSQASIPPNRSPRIRPAAAQNGAARRHSPATDAKMATTTAAPQRHLTEVLVSLFQEKQKTSSELRRMAAHGTSAANKPTIPHVIKAPPAPKGGAHLPSLFNPSGKRTLTVLSPYCRQL
jgi:hypothetical protein